MSLLEVSRISKSYGARRLLTNVELTLFAGKSYVLTGENGSGKSTLLRILAGLERPDDGWGRFDHQRFNWLPYPSWLRRNLIYVHQQPYLFHTTVADNIEFGLRARGVMRQERRRRLAEAIAWARLSHLLETPPQRLSGGEKQRVALARAWVLQPRMLLLDEPTANLDAESQRQAVDLLHSLCSAGTSLLLACHDRDVIELPAMQRLQLAAGSVHPTPGATD